MKNDRLILVFDHFCRFNFPGRAFALAIQSGDKNGETKTHYYLGEMHPDLTVNDRKLSAFLKLKLSTKDISSITGQSVKSIEVARSRLRKKLKLHRKDNLFDVLERI